MKKEVKAIFNSGKVLEYLNITLIMLIPKFKSPKTLNNYRPISLCIMVYKVVTKIIVGRIGPLLSRLISPFQLAFVLGRKDLDNAIIVQEIIHSMAKKKGRGGNGN